ncbi:MAG: hypothetical protein AAGA97_12980 [Pseudomonadota bacterium]
MPRFALILAGLAFATWTSADDLITDTSLNVSRFEAATLVVLQASTGSDQKTAYLWVYQSALGSALKNRNLTDAETVELQRICAHMHKAGRRLQRGGFDGYGIEFANGTGDTSKLSPSRRVVFFFWDKGQCTSAPSRGKIE